MNRRFAYAFGLLCAAALLVALRAPARAQASGVKVERDVPYGEAGGQKLLLDVYSPEHIASTRPAVILVHGGGWSGGDKKDFAFAGEALAKNGYVAFSINYRLVTKDANKWPAQLDDSQRAVRWVRAHAAQYQIDPKRIGALGASAGGHLVALLGTRDARDNSDPTLSRYSSKVECVVDMFGPTDFTISGGQISPAAAAIVVNFLGKKPDEAPGVYRAASPITYVSSTAAPFLIFHGTNDTLVPIEQSQRLYDALKKAGVEATFIKMPNDGHGFARPENQQRFAAETKAFLDRHLHP